MRAHPSAHATYRHARGRRRAKLLQQIWRCLTCYFEARAYAIRGLDASVATETLFPLLEAQCRHVPNAGDRLMMSGKRTSGFYEWCVVHAEFVLGVFGREPGFYGAAMFWVSSMNRLVGRSC